MSTAESTGAGMGSREKIIVAACEMLGEDAEASLSVRSVATRAGVSMGSLRYHFPTQKVLREAVMKTIYDVVAADDPIHERAIAVRDRLVLCLRQVLSPGVGEEARRAWRTVFESFIAPEPTDEIRQTYLAMSREGHRRVEYWLTVVAEEGALEADQIGRSARFLSTVLDGLSIERALPAEETILKTESETLYWAVDSVLQAQSSKR